MHIWADSFSTERLSRHGQSSWSKWQIQWTAQKHLQIYLQGAKLLVYSSSSINLNNRKHVVLSFPQKVVPLFCSVESLFVPAFGLIKSSGTILRLTTDCRNFSWLYGASKVPFNTWRTEPELGALTIASRGLAWAERGTAYLQISVISLHRLQTRSRVPRRKWNPTLSAASRTAVSRNKALISNSSKTSSSSCQPSSLSSMFCPDRVSSRLINKAIPSAHEHVVISCSPNSQRVQNSPWALSSYLRTTWWDGSCWTSWQEHQRPPSASSARDRKKHTASSGKYINTTAPNVDIPCVYRVCVLHRV